MKDDELTEAEQETWDVLSAPPKWKDIELEESDRNGRYATNFEVEYTANGDFKVVYKVNKS